MKKNYNTNNVDPISIIYNSVDIQNNNPKNNKEVNIFFIKSMLNELENLLNKEKIIASNILCLTRNLLKYEIIKYQIYPSLPKNYTP
jgi:hypothetical protein